MTYDFDVIVVGGGHNGLVCGAYIAQAGERVLVLERHTEPGGCIATARIPGYPETCVDIGGLEHGVFAGSHAMRDLKLTDFGLRYLERDHIYTFVVDGKPAWAIHGDRAKSRATIARFSLRDADAFDRFAELSDAVQTLLDIVCDGPPPNLAELADLARAGGSHAGTLMQTFLSNPRQVVESWFEHDWVRAGLVNFATHAQTPPWQLGSGYAPCLALGGQGQGGKRPEGGGRSLIQALRRCLEHHGGSVRCNAAVRRILVNKRRAVGVELESGEQITARRAVISAIDARRVFTELIAPEHLAPGFLQAMERITSGRDNIGEMSMACVLGETPLFAQAKIGAGAFKGSFWQSGDVADIENTFTSIRRGELPRCPNFMWAVPSVLDPTQAPKGKHVLWTAGFVPYQLSGGRNWDAVKDEAADILLAQIGRVAPNVAGSVLAREVMSPLDWHRRTGNPFGNADHIDTTIDQMLGNRPSPLVARYRTPVRSLYLTGAGTHPGGGITGGPGRNTAQVVMRDLGLARRPNAREIASGVKRVVALARAAMTMRRYI